ncbi:MAG TPA: glycosyltransferase family 2 protein [Sphingomonadaceae bacterium]|nr:glycosyltransferase family 2 protein [Sphingomonadaceae bacterium]
MSPGEYRKQQGLRADVTRPGGLWLSILLPVYNVEPYLRACIASITSQMDWEGAEIILLEDGSTDGSLALCRALVAEHDGRITLLRSVGNGGLSKARNRMLDVARGDYVWFVDSDDEMRPGALAQLRGIVDACAPDVVLCDYRKRGRVYASFIGEAGRLATDNEALVRGVFESRRMHIWTKIARRSLWGADLRFPNSQLFEDMAVVPRLFARAETYYYAPTPWIDYRVRPGSVTARVSRTRGYFDEQGNDDLCHALEGYAAALLKTTPDVQPSTLYAIANFCAKEFTKIVYRLLRARLFRDNWTTNHALLDRYYRGMEGCSPIAFPDLVREHVRRRRFGRWALLTLCLGIHRLGTRRHGRACRS